MVTKQPLDIFAIGGQRGGGGGGIGWGRDDGHRPCSPSFPSLFFLIKDLRVAFFRETECRMCRWDRRRPLLFTEPTTDRLQSTVLFIRLEEKEAGDGIVSRKIKKATGRRRGIFFVKYNLSCVTKWNDGGTYT